MDRVLVLIVVTSELRAASSRPRLQYHVVKEPKNITEAMSYCRETYTDIATIINMEDVTVLNEMVGHKISEVRGRCRLTDSTPEETLFCCFQYAWIGLHEDISDWRWSLADEMLQEGDFSNWDLDQPAGSRSEQHCVAMMDTGRWFDHTCDDPIQAVCMDVTGPNVTFVLTGSLMTCAEAQSHCRAKHADLATVRNMPENQRVKEMVPASHAVWIGLFRDSWKWLDGHKSSFRYWNHEMGEPDNNLGNEFCVAAVFLYNGKWGDWNCDRRIPFICYSSAFSKQVMKVKLKSSVDLNDPAVMEDVLKQLKQRLKDQGVTEEVRLSWRKQPDGKIFHRDEKKPKKKTKCPKTDEL